MALGKSLIGGALALAMMATSAGTGALAQDNTQTLADIRQELTVLYVELQKLKTELSTTGGASAPSGAGTALDRVNAFEAEIARLTARTEELGFRIDQVVKDGTNKVGDLEFRLCELEPACDIATLGDTPTLGGGELPAVAAPAAQAPATGPADGGSQLAVAEQADFNAAKTAFEGGNASDAVDRFARFVETYPGGPLTGEANYLRGEALSELGNVAEAARAYLAAYSGSPDAGHAPDALLKLGTALGQLGQVNEACVTLGEVLNRFPAAAATSEAQSVRASLGCN